MKSRIARNPIALPTGVEVNVSGQEISIKGAKGTLKHHVHPLVKVAIADKQVTFATNDATAQANVQAGTSRALINNMIVGVSKGYERKLVLVGVGYRAQVQGKALNLSVGFSHPVAFVIPVGITIETPSQTEIIIKGADKQQVGQLAANIRAVRPPEPYKGKGIRYSDEEVIIKETKKK